MLNLKKSLFAVCAVVVVSGLLASFMLMYTRRYDDGFVLQDESGDRSHLNDVEFYGVLADDIQQTTFRFAGNNWNKKFSFVTDEDSMKRYNYLQGYKDSSLYPSLMVCSIDMTDVMPNPNPDSWQEDSYGNRSEAYTGKGIVTYSVNNRRFSSDVIWNGNMTKNPGSEIVSGYDNNGYHLGAKGYVWQDDKLFLYTLTDSACSGYGGVYDITELFKAGWAETRETNNTKGLAAVPVGPGAVKADLPNIAPLDLEDGNVQILDMVATEKRFIYLFLRGQSLNMRPFNLLTNSFENEIEVGQIPQNADEQSKDAYNTQGIKPRGNFTEIVSKENIICLAVFSNPSSGLYAGNYFQGLRCAFYSVDIEKGTLLQSYMDEPLDNAKTSIKNIEMIYRNDNLYVLRKYSVSSFEGSGSHSPESRLKISVYKDNKSIYQGNILSGAQEDYKYQLQDVNLGRTPIRDYYFIGIK